MFPIDNTLPSWFSVVMSELELFSASIVPTTYIDATVEESLDGLGLDAIVATHSQLTVVSFVCEGSTGIGAVKSAAQTLARIGIQCLRTYPDLVSRQAIADRTGLSRQAIGNWIRGDRKADDPFPPPVNLVGGGAWLWGEVDEWLKRQGYEADPVRHLSLKEHAVLDNWLLTNKLGGTRGNFQDAHVIVDASSTPRFLRSVETEPVTTSSWVRIEGFEHV